MKISYILFLLSLSLSATNAHGQNTNPLRDSLEAATTALAQAPDSIDLRLKKAGWNVQLHQWDYAKDDYDKVLFADPNNMAALYYRAYVNVQLGRYNFARLDYQNLLKLVPGNFEAQLGLALLNEKDKHYTEAMDGINILVEQYPDSALAYAARAGIERDRGMYLLAEYDFTQAIVRDPTNTGYILARADVCLEQGKKREAQRDLEMVVALGIPRANLQDYFDKLKL